jgi:Bacteriophage replication protein O
VTSKKTRKYGDLSARPLPTEEASLVDDVFAAFTRRPSAPAPDGPALAENAMAAPALVETSVAAAAIAETPPRPSQIAAMEKSTIAGFTRVPNVILDRLMATLKPSDQSVLLRLYRLSHGFGKATCTVGYGTLSKACNLSIRQVQTCVERLILAGLIERLSVENSGKQNQSKGSEYRVNLPSPSAVEKSAVANSAIAGSADNKDKALKETSKGASLCPDCSNTGFWYPQGIGKGVAKCKHKNLKREST